MATKLRVISGGGTDDDFGLLPSAGSGTAAPLESDLGQPMLRRPGDHIETLWLEDPSSLFEVREAARRRRLFPDTATAVVLERRLAAQALNAFGGAGLINELDDRSAHQTAEVELWSAHSAYLTHLLHGLRPCEPAAPLSSVRLSVPIRLIDRLAAGIPGGHEPVEIELSHAISWEVASLSCSETLSEWAYRSALACASVSASR